MAAILSLNKDTGLYWLLASIWRHHLIWAHGLIIRPIPTHYDTHLKNLSKSTKEEGLRLETASLQNRRSFGVFEANGGKCKASMKSKSLTREEQKEIYLRNSVS